MTLCTLGIDLGKTTFHLVGLDEHGTIAAKKRVSRTQLLGFTASLPVCLIGREACCGAHHLGEALAAQGHQIKPIPPQFVRPFVRGNKGVARGGRPH